MHRYTIIPFYLLAEISIIACDLAEIIGTAIALNLLFGLPLVYGVVITALDVLIIMFGYGNGKAIKIFELVIMIMVFVVMICFIILMVKSKPVAKDVFWGFIPDFKLLSQHDALYVAMGILGGIIVVFQWISYHTPVSVLYSIEYAYSSCMHVLIISNCDAT